MKAIIVFVIVGAIVLFFAIRYSAWLEEFVGKMGSVETTQQGQSPQGQLEIEDLVVGDGAMARTGDTVSVHYVGTLTSGDQFDSSRDRGEPFELTLGARPAIKGWGNGDVDMRVGGIRKLTIPPPLAYGQTGQGTIPPNSTLVFEVELLGIVESGGALKKE